MLHHAGSVRRAVARALLGTNDRPPSYLAPQAKSAHRFAWDVSGDCEDPVHRDFYGKPWRDQGLSVYIHPEWLEIRARCRECRTCLRHRRRLWSGRALGELRESMERDERVWFVTLTANADARTNFKMEARKHFIDGGKAPAIGVPAAVSARKGLPCSDWEHLPEAKQFGSIHQRIGPQITLWLKRLRQLPIRKWRNQRRLVKEAFRRQELPFAEVMRLTREWEELHPQPKPLRFRYLIVCEAHKETEVFPHYHLLIHEKRGNLTERALRSEWRGRFGFAEATLVHFGEKLLKPDPRKPGRTRLVRGQPEDWLYLCKYLSKSALARVRASQRYGRGHPEADPAPQGIERGRNAEASASPAPLGALSQTRPEDPQDVVGRGV